MADYKELLRRAVEALPENTGPARRAVYEKARAALVGQLRAINPPLPARDITTHRLQLEDCIRLVEQESSEANISGIGKEAPPANLPPVFAADAKAAPKAAKPAELAKAAAKPEPAKAEAKPNGKADAGKAKPTNSIEAIIAAAERDRAEPPPPQAAKAPELKQRPPKSQPVLVAKTDLLPAKAKAPPEPAAAAARPAAATARPDGRPLPSIVARAEAAKGRPVAAPAFAASASDGARRGPKIEPRRDGRLSIAAARRPDPMPLDEPDQIPAMSAVREVEVERADPQRDIDRAIATLDREARGEIEPPSYDDEPVYDDEPMQAPRRNGRANGRGDLNGRGDMNGRGDFNGHSNGRDYNGRGDMNGRDRDYNGRSAIDVPMGRDARPSRPAKEFATPRRTASPSRDRNVARARPERGGMGAVTIFVIIFGALLIGAGGAGVWAWQEGFINLDAMFGKGNTVVAAAAPVVTPDSTGPGNTDTPVTRDASTQLKSDQRLQTAAATPDAATAAPLALQSPAGDGKNAERLGGDAQPQTAQDATVAAIDPASVAGSQSLLLEASDTGKTGAVPFSGTVDWSKGVDENGLPTLIGKANIPARNLAVQVLIRKNSDPSLPASHLMEINFTVSDSFIGGSIAGLPGVLLKNEELVQGSPLVGASARVVGNSFLFALSATPADATANANLLTSRKWMDLALIYASGKRAIITLEKDDKAQKMFNDVFAAWGVPKTGNG